MRKSNSKNLELLFYIILENESFAGKKEGEMSLQTLRVILKNSYDEGELLVHKKEGRKRSPLAYERIVYPAILGQ
ncbi:hypothetical protein [Bacillus cereus group sp. BfR-BA-01430]|uniref:hypothetical protein n=1 Tax=Bacillus cereus group sp. BfR-BA-01430 TaxID=2920346 RepID=UPI001F59835C|nr:hypothetical protein [Bacillus cereus group sp. BfR-BA-01430]